LTCLANSTPFHQPLTPNAATSQSSSGPGSISSAASNSPVVRSPNAFGNAMPCGARSGVSCSVVLSPGFAVAGTPCSDSDEKRLSSFGEPKPARIDAHRRAIKLREDAVMLFDRFHQTGRSRNAGEHAEHAREMLRLALVEQDEAEAIYSRGSRRHLAEVSNPFTRASKI
jgi:hypothetical protein